MGVGRGGGGALHLPLAGQLCLLALVQRDDLLQTDGVCVCLRLCKYAHIFLCGWSEITASVSLFFLLQG